MYIESVPNRGSPPAILLRESFRDDGRVRKRTLANLSAWPSALVEGFRTLLEGRGRRRRGRHPHPPRAAARPCRRGAGHDPGDRPRPAARPADRQAPGARGDRVDCQPPGLARLQARHRARPRRRYRRARAWAGCSGSARSTRSSSIARSTGSARARPRSRPRSPAAISRTGRWCFTTSPRPGSKAGAASWRASATRGTARRANCRSSTACCVPPMAARWRSKCSRATPPTR